MRIVVVGGTGLIGAKVVRLLDASGHEVTAAARETGVNSYTADGLPEALEGAEVLIDVSNSSYLDEFEATDFFEVSTLNLLTYGRIAGVRHHVALSVVGTERLATDRGYFRAKALQEELIVASNTPYSIVHATQFFEFLRSIAEAAAGEGRVRVADVLIRPMAADDVAAAVARVALGDPVGRVVEVAGPETFRLGDLLRKRLRARPDPREVIADPLARYFGSVLSDDELLPAAGAETAHTRFADWLAGPSADDQPRSAVQASS
jgi:uncharacterized protein YbjT (DUF2867 family)